MIRYALPVVIACAAAAGVTQIPSSGQATYTEHIAPVLARSCAPCHRPGGPAPFTLASYGDAQKRAKQLAADVSSYFMPPCQATTDFGRFCTYAPVTDDEVVLISQWAARGAPEGPRNRELPGLPRIQRWPHGKPDLILRPNRRILIPSEGHPQWRTIMMPTVLPRGKRIRALWVEPKSPQVLWHALVFRTNPKTKPRLSQRSASPAAVPGPDVLGIWAGDILSAWRPGWRSLDLPAGAGIALAEGEGLAIQALYHPTGKTEDGGFELGLYLQDGSAEPQWLTLGTKDIAVAADQRAMVRSERKLEHEVDVLAVHPEAGLSTTNMVLAAVLPDGTVKQLWSVFKWDPLWMGSYRFERPVRLPAGTTLRAVSRIDNSSHNPRYQGQKLMPLKYGPGLEDERFWVHVQYLRTGPTG